MSQDKEADAAALYLGEGCELVGRFSRTDTEATYPGPLAELAESLYHSLRGRRAHRLPASFLLALTAEQALFLKYGETQSEVLIGEEVLVLDRDAIRFIVGQELLTLAATEGGICTTSPLIGSPSTSPPPPPSSRLCRNSASRARGSVLVCLVGPLAVQLPVRGIRLSPSPPGSARTFHLPASC